LEFNYLSGYYTDTKFFKSQDEIFYRERYLLFPYVTVDSKLVLYTKLLGEAGIYDKMKEYFIIDTRRHRKALTLSIRPTARTVGRPQKISLGDRINTIFFFFAILLLISALSCTGEYFFIVAIKRVPYYFKLACKLLKTLSAIYFLLIPCWKEFKREIIQLKSIWNSFAQRISNGFIIFARKSKQST